MTIPRYELERRSKVERSCLFPRSSGWPPLYQGGCKFGTKNRQSGKIGWFEGVILGTFGII